MFVSREFSLGYYCTIGPALIPVITETSRCYANFFFWYERLSSVVSLFPKKSAEKV
jgi:hypothetical protein